MDKAELEHAIEDKIVEWSAAIDRMRDDVEKVHADAYRSAHEELRALEKQKHDLAVKLEALKDASRESWEKMARETEKEFEDMRKSFERGVKRIREWDKVHG